MFFKMGCRPGEEFWNRRHVPVRVTGGNMSQVMHEQEDALVYGDRALAPSCQNSAGERVTQIMQSGAGVETSVLKAFN